MNHKKILTILGITVAVLVIALFIAKVIKDKKDAAAAELAKNAAATTDKPAAAEVKPTPTDAKVDAGFPIKYLVYSEKAKEIQKYLGVPQDGKIGRITLDAWRTRCPIAPLLADNTKFQINDLKHFNDLFNQLKSYKPANQLVASMTDLWYNQMTNVGNPMGV